MVIGETGSAFKNTGDLKVRPRQGAHDAPLSLCSYVQSHASLSSLTPSCLTVFPHSIMHDVQFMPDSQAYQHSSTRPPRPCMCSSCRTSRPTCSTSPPPTLTRTSLSPTSSTGPGIRTAEIPGVLWTGEGRGTERGRNPGLVYSNIGEGGMEWCGPAEQCGAEWCRPAERCGAEWCGAEWCGAEWCGAEWCEAEWRGAAEKGAT